MMLELYYIYFYECGTFSAQNTNIFESLLIKAYTSTTCIIHLFKLFFNKLCCFQWTLGISVIFSLVSLKTSIFFSVSLVSNYSCNCVKQLLKHFSIKWSSIPSEMKLKWHGTFSAQITNMFLFSITFYHTSSYKKFHWTCFK